jgi:regulator of sirC expression with transglutaminase-like and TPR domain
MAQAVIVLKRDIALHPYSTERFKMLALAYIKLVDYQQALETVERELELFPQDSVMRALFEWVRASSSASRK